MRQWYIFANSPVSEHWNPLAMASDARAPLLQILLNVTDLLVDIFILSLPLPIIRSAQMSKKRKLVIIGIFWLGTW